MTCQKAGIDCATSNFSRGAPLSTSVVPFLSLHAKRRTRNKNNVVLLGQDEMK